MPMVLTNQLNPSKHELLMTEFGSVWTTQSFGCAYVLLWSRSHSDTSTPKTTRVDSNDAYKFYEVESSKSEKFTPPWQLKWIASFYTTSYAAELCAVIAYQIKCFFQQTSAKSFLTHWHEEGIDISLGFHGKRQSWMKSDRNDNFIGRWEICCTQNEKTEPWN